LILDNFEQVVDFAEETIGRWLDLAPEVSFLVTSRERLKLPVEVIHELTPLELPQPSDDIRSSEAVKLFVDRAEAVCPGYDLSESEWPAVADVVRHLDGMPLAIELAAARSSVLTPPQILERLQRPRELLSMRSDRHTGRQSTLWRTIEWSWNMLTLAEQMTLAQLSVFRGGFSLEAAEAIVSLSDVSETPGVFDVVQSLRDKSLVRAYQAPEFQTELRLGLYKSIQEFSEERLPELPGAATCYGRHAEFYVGVCTSLAESSSIDGGMQSTRRLQVELENLVVVFHREMATEPLTTAAITTALRALLAMAPVLLMQRHSGLYLDWLAHTLSLEQVESVDWSLLSKAYDKLGRAAHYSQAPSKAIPLLERSLSLSESYGDEQVKISVLQWLGRLLAIRGEIDRAVLSVTQAREVIGDTSDLRQQFETTKTLGFVYYYSGRFDEAADIFERCLHMARELGDQTEIEANMYNVADASLEAGNWKRAFEYVCYAISTLKSDESNTQVVSMAKVLYTYILGRYMGDSSSADSMREWVSFADQLETFSLQLETRYYLTDLLYHYERYDEALEAAQGFLAVARNDESPFSRRRSAELYEKIRTANAVE